MHTAAKTVLLAGASGVVGSALLQQLLSDESVASVLALMRRPLAIQHQKLQILCVDFAALPDLAHHVARIDECYIALGSTIKTAGSREAFRRVDLDAVLAVAQAAQRAACPRLAAVSALEADAQSRIFYSRIKGQMEQGLSAMGFARLVLARPSLIDGDRAALGQPHRRGEAWALGIMKALSPLIPLAYAPITGAAIAQAMRQRLRADGAAVEVLRSGLMQKMALQAHP